MGFIHLKKDTRPLHARVTCLFANGMHLYPIEFTSEDPL